MPEYGKWLCLRCGKPLEVTPPLLLSHNLPAIVQVLPCDCGNTAEGASDAPRTQEEADAWFDNGIVVRGSDA